jgi:hypothetical protein
MDETWMRCRRAHWQGATFGLVVLVVACSPVHIGGGRDGATAVPNDAEPFPDVVDGDVPYDAGQADGSDLAPVRDVGGDTAGDAAPDAASDGDADVRPGDPLWTAFLQRRRNHLAELAQPIMDCVVQEDTTHPVFHGCYDWHSAVHGVWALHALSRVTGDDQYRGVAEPLLTRASITAEMQAVQRGDLDDSENPYGYAWFLALARERRRAGSSDLVAMAHAVAQRLEHYLDNLSSRQRDALVRSDDYTNLSWAVYNLWAYAREENDSPRVGRMEAYGRSELLSRQGLCPLSSESGRVADFFPPCLNLAFCLTAVLAAAETATWLVDAAPREGLGLVPLTYIPRAHPAGLNFSRAWGLWQLYQATGYETYRDAFRNHVETHLSQPQYWDGDHLDSIAYLNYSHWVPQFGVFALALTYGGLL